MENHWAPWLLSALFLLLLAVMMVPLTPWVLDALLTFNLALSVLVLAATLQVRRPIELSIFPTLLLIGTLLRLALNIASSRLVLLHGHQGDAAAGRVIESFGHFFMAGNYTVGFVLFLILVLVNFMVITKGAGRIAEVAARFTLDSLPGKQMAIDSELQAGSINTAEAHRRREQLSREADFHGAMDGAAKFIRGDAIVAILVVSINSIGGILLAVLQHDLSLAQAGRNYLLLTVGDGLATQIPALILSAAAGLLVSRASAEAYFPNQLFRQLFHRAGGLWVVAVTMALFGLWPGMPHGFFLAAALIFAILAWGRQSTPQSVSTPPPTLERDVDWSDVHSVDQLRLEVGLGLVPTRERAIALAGEIRGLRKRVTMALGFLCPPIHIRDDLSLKAHGYRFFLRGALLGEGELRPGHRFVLTRDEGQMQESSPTGQWLSHSEADKARRQGYQVIDSSELLTTHLWKLLKVHGEELLGRQETRQLLEHTLGTVRSKELVERIPLGLIQQVLQGLLAEEIPLHDIPLIADVMLEQNPAHQNVDTLLAQVRIALRRAIVHRLVPDKRSLEAIVLPVDLEQSLLQQGAALSPQTIQPLMAQIANRAREKAASGEKTLLLTRQALRRPLARLCRRTIPNVAVLVHEEIPDDHSLHLSPLFNPT